ncbi:methylated-DNA--[protein]-cysteine S-methyltransferase [Sphingomonas yabuuchiae]|uniref:Methylated-DNA--protein-cysteine methyltransferase n=2 Tax=Sphingomonas yabuuchiae TaxID=172044 RepID=A0AA40ZYD1_9SPHN|nr:methylated-DNA--[protein]-cysteine S-methyltransferase [Sphingomonas yabuuchiae]MBB4609785.1 methylated-DNA-[protein]-cysteine S-methyltransferase [Sphingomonas yabuuchiae]MBN3558097.1 methylated-DNA--[protein]-cysteine S-methyltransferase [Sphingomonas yabuuchiae]
MLSQCTMASPVGELTLVASEQGLRAVLWAEERVGRVMLPERQGDPAHAILTEAVRQLTEYFAGERHVFDLPLDPVGTDFQKAVWTGLNAIPYGETRSYAALATAIGRPGASRAVGAANGRNPLSIVTPCHRVIGANGTLTGFAGGLAVKQWLLAHERGEPTLALA